MAVCPACGIESPPDSSECPRCHLAVNLFGPVREAAGDSGLKDPTYLRTIGELLATVDLEKAAEPSRGSPRNLASRPERRPTPEAVEPMSLPAPRPAPALEAAPDLPPLPANAGNLTEMEHRVQEYLQLGRRLGLDFADFRGRASAAVVSADADSMEVLAREMFVHLSSAIVEEYELLLGRRNELSQLVPTPTADVELTAVRRAIGVGDLPGAARRLELVRDELSQAEQQWEVGRILVTEADLMMTTIRELGGDPSPAAGPLEEGRRLFADGRRADSERVLARAAVALWTLLEPRLLDDLRRLRDRMVEARSAGVDITPAIGELRAVSVELRQRNFVGTIVAYRNLRAFVDRTSPPGVEAAGPSVIAAEVRSPPPA